MVNEDPYAYPGTSILRNHLGLHDSRALAEYEYRLTLERRIELELDPIQGPFDFARLKETHRRLFQDIYPWAGQTRTVDISKDGSHFHPATHIDTAALVVFGKRGWLAQSGLLHPNVGDEAFVVGAAALLEKLNYIHPFREGNGRTQRAFLDQVAAVSGRTLAWRNVSQADHHLASVRSFNEGTGEAFEPILRRALEPPMDGLSRLVSESYTVNALPSAQTLAERRRRFPELFGERDASDVDPEGPEY